MTDRLVYRDDCGNEETCLGRKIYHEVFSDRRGFRPDQIGIDESDDVWAEIFEDLGRAALELRPHADT